jgi:hypothetical protein
LVKAIATLPAFAVSEVVLNFSWPSGSAARFRVCPPPAAGAGLEEVAELDVVGVAAELDVFGVAAELDVFGVAAELDVVGVAAELDGEEAGELVLVEELPQPARASRPAITNSVETLGMEHVLTRAAALKLIASDPLIVGTVSC